MSSKPKKGITKTRIVLSTVWFVVAVALSVGLGIGDYYCNVYTSVISTFFGQDTTKVIDSDEYDSTDAEWNPYPAEYDSEDDLRADSSEVAKQVMDEGVVLLRNEDNALPISTTADDGSSTKVTLFSGSSYGENYIYGGTGSGQVDTSTALSLENAFSQEGYDVNEAVASYYEDNYRGRSGSAGMGASTMMNEISFSDLISNSGVSNSLISNGYLDGVAIITISRTGGEGADLVYNDSSTTDGQDGNYLQLTEEEESVIEAVTGHGEYGSTYQFDKVVLVLNVSNMVQFDHIQQYFDGIDAIIWAGAPGQDGIQTIPDIVSGAVNPSGRLSDTILYNNLSNPAVNNFGAEGFWVGNEQPNMDVTSRDSSTYVVYQEGIYVGYRYYETRYEDAISGDVGALSDTLKSDWYEGNEWNYDNEVAYPFGYGLSYTTWEYSDISVTESEDGDNLYYNVTVTNTGSVAGKNSVEVYLQKPYTDYDKKYGVEKASAELVGYDKTDTLEPGESQEISVEIPKEALRTYDENNEKTYIFEAPTDDNHYYLSSGNGVHDALNNILALKGTISASDLDSDYLTSSTGSSTLAVEIDNYLDDLSLYSFKYSYENESYGDDGYEITNQFDQADPSAYGSDITYTTRSDWQNTLATSYYKFEVTQDVFEQLESELTAVTTIEEDPTDEMPLTSQVNGLSLASIRDKDYYDEDWDLLVQQMSPSELYYLVGDGDYHTNSMTSVGCPGMTTFDGPQGISASMMSSMTANAEAHPCEPILAATRNYDLIYEVGHMVAEDGKYYGVAGWYAPGANIHRTPYAGRNFEYFSEDPILSGTMNAAEVSGACENGLAVYSKHFAFNDQETNRTGITTWFTEQAGREIYLRSFEFATTYGNCNGYMSAFNEIGTEWCGGCYNLLTNVLRNEWGFEGCVITDYAMGSYMHMAEGLQAGNDLWLNPQGQAATSLQSDYEDNATVIKLLQQAAKNVLYQVAHSHAMNGVTPGSTIVSIMPTWKKWLIVANVVIYALIIVATVFVIRGLVIRRKGKTDDTAEVTEETTASE